MAWPTDLNIALKEWATVCRALDEGRQMLLLRKGGIYESAGEFEIEHREFLLFPTYLHQNAPMLKPAEHEHLTAATAEPTKVTLTTAAIISDIIELKSREAMDRLAEFHIWAKPLIDMRFAYRPQNPLYLLLVRAYRLHAPQTINQTPAYAGCKSWVPLESAVDTGNALPVMDDVKFEFARKAILARLND